MRILVIIFLLLLIGCSNKNTHYIYPCKMKLPSCRVEVEKPRTLPDEIKFREDEMKNKMLRSMNLILDNLIQSIIKESL